MRHSTKLFVLTAIIAALSACGTSDVPIDAEDAGTALDGAGPEADGAGVSLDMGASDAGSATTDAGPVDMDPQMDAGTTADMSTGPDFGDAEPCTTGSRDGYCLPTADCVGMNQSVPGFCPGPADIQCCVPVDDSTCLEDPSVDQMPQPNAGLSEAPGQGGCPDGMTAVSNFCVDRFEAALMEVLADGTERPWSPYHNPGTRRVRAVSIEGAVPQAYISGDQARAACAEAGKRLCTDVEWLRACQGANGSTYPYGDTRQDGVCNDARATHPAVEYFGSADQSTFSMLDNACIGQQADTVDPAGQNDGCVSDDGVFDMMGNLHEWTSNPTGVFRGGFYVDTYRNGDGCLYDTEAHNTPHWDYSTGFRCCAD